MLSDMASHYGSGDRDMDDDDDIDDDELSGDDDFSGNGDGDQGKIFAVSQNFTLFYIIIFIYRYYYTH